MADAVAEGSGGCEGEEGEEGEEEGGWAHLFVGAGGVVSLKWDKGGWMERG